MAKRGLKIIIVGVGKIGQTLVKLLTRERHDIVIIDKNEKIVAEMANAYDCMGVCGNGASHSVLEDAGVMDADLIISVTASDEFNLLCCTIAKQYNEDLATIARVRSPEFAEDSAYLRETLGMAMIVNPELETARETARILFLPTALSINTFAHGQAELIRIKIPENNYLAGKTLGDLPRNLTEGLIIVGVEHDEEVIIPNGSSRLEAGDIISFVSTRKKTISFLKSIGFATRSVSDTLIVGGGSSSYYLSKELIRSGIDVKIIESNPARCEQLSILVPRASIINGDGTREELLLESGLAEAESFVPLTGIDEENILLTLYAGTVSKAKVVTKINRISFDKVIESLDLGSVVCPRNICAETILSYVRARQASLDSNLEVLYKLFGNRAEAMEFTVKERSEVTGVPLKDLNTKPGVIISFIGRGRDMIIPSGSDTIEVGDSVMVVTTQSGFTDLRDILG
ncbi:MAG: Trk system potassium transporter TrkA [Clostridiales bacterium]|nr:Trk system potassium transporter TrkA [Clostridiales bacterium]